MKNEAQRNAYVTRDALVKLLSEGEVARVSTREGGPELAIGDEYVDLEHLDLGVRRMEAGRDIKMGEVLPRGAVHDSTWSQIVARLSPGAAKP